MTSNLQLTGISIANDERALFENLSISVQPGQVVTLMGPSGSGKSTLLAYVAGFLAKTFSAQGAVNFDGRDISKLPAEKRKVGLLFQDDLLLPHLSVQQNLMFGLQNRDPNGQKRNRQTKLDLVADALTAAGLDGFQHRRPATLSGGQRARVALIRTLLSEPHVLLLDEPFSKLDTDLRRAFRTYVLSEIETRQLPTLLVTHDHEDANHMNGPVLQLSGNGSISVK